jgi:hypothetical protein
MEAIPLGNSDPTRLPYPSVEITEWTTEVDPEKTKTKPFTISPAADSKIVVYPGMVNGVMAKIGTVALDDAITPSLLITAPGPVYLEITYSGSWISSVKVLSGTVPGDTRMVKYRQIGTVNLQSGIVYVTAQLVSDNIIISGSFTPFFLEGFIESGDAKIYVRPGLVNNLIPTIGGVDIDAIDVPSITVSGTTGQIWAQAILVSDVVISVALANLTSPPTDDATHKHRLIGTWDSADSKFTEVTSIINTNQTLYICRTSAIWE